MIYLINLYLFSLLNRSVKQTCKYFTELQKFNCNIKPETILGV